MKFIKPSVSLVGVCVALGLTAPSLMAQDTMIVRLSIRVSDFRFDTLNGYDIIRSQDNRVAYVSDPGKPMLPVFVPTYIIPYWKTVSYCEVVSKDSAQVPGFWRIYPAQSSADTSWVPPDSAVYYSDSLYPGIPTGKIDLGSFDGAVLARPEANMFQYRPLSGKLFLYTDMTIKLVFKDSEPPINAKERYAHVQAIYDDMLSELVENDENIGAWYRRPAIIEPGSKTNPDVFAIITTQNQMDEAGQYADWTDRRGYPTIVVDVNTITSSTPGRNNAEKVFNWIQQHYQLGLSFVLFLGHENEVPYRYLKLLDVEGPPQPPNKYTIEWVPSDLYFSSVSCQFTDDCDYYWDCDGDEAYGEQTADVGSWDYYPEVFVGRVLSRKNPFINETQNWVTKVLKYEKDPGQAGHLHRVKFISCDDPCLDCEETEAHYSSTFIFNDLYYKPSGEVLDSLKAGNYGWVNIYSHGEPTVFFTKFSPVRDSILSVPDEPNYPDLSDLTNENKYFLVYNTSCKQACFDSGDSLNWTGYPPYRLSDTTIAEGFTEAYPLKGAVAFLGNTRAGVVTPPGSYDLHRFFLDYIFTGTDPDRYLIGVPEAYSRAQIGLNHHVARTHNLFGSPLTDMWDIAAPKILYTQHPTSIPSGQQSFTVRVLKSLKPVTPLRGTMVSLKGCNVYVFDTTDVNGYVTFQINPQGPGIMKVTTTKHNYKPKESDCTVMGRGPIALSEGNFLPEVFFLSVKSSNPANGPVLLEFGIPVEDAGHVSLSVYDISGRVVAVLLDGEFSAGYYKETWEPADQPGIYFLILRTGSKSLTKKIIVGRRER